MKITVFGSGYVGLVTSVCLAKLGHTITCYDIDAARIEKLQKGHVPFFEPGLESSLHYVNSRGLLSFTNDEVTAVNNAEVIFNCVGTPMKDDGSANLEYVYNVAKTVGRLATKPVLLVNKSTVPPGTAQACSQFVNEHVTVVSNPEFLREGAAIYDFTHPNKIVIGTSSDDAFQTMRKVYTGRMRTYIPIMHTNWETAEMIKYANNSFLATKISFINEIANICDTVGADIKIISQAMGLDFRISPKFLNAGIGYGGSCFPKDVRALIAKGNENAYKAHLLEAVDNVNSLQRKRFFEKIKQNLGDLNGKKIAVLGLSFKPNTTDCRESPALDIIPWLQNEGVQVIAHDPMASNEFKNMCPVHIIDNIQDVKGSDALIILTEWDDYRALNYDEIGVHTVFDARNIIEPDMFNIKYYGIGRQ